MSSNYFDDMSAAVDEEEISEDFDDADDEDDTVDEDSLSDGVSHSKKNSYDMEDIEEYNGPSQEEKNRTMNLKVENKLPSYQDDFSNNSDLSLSNYHMNKKQKSTEVVKKKKKKREEDLLFDDDFDDSYRKKEKKPLKKGNKILLILLGVILVIGVIIGLVVYSTYQRNSAPAIREVHIESDNFDNDTAQYGNMITLTFTFNEEIVGLPTVIIMGKQVEVFGEGTTFYAKYFVQDQEDEDQLVTFTIKDYYDSLNKSGPPVTTTTDSSQVVIEGYHFS